MSRPALRGIARRLVGRSYVLSKQYALERMRRRRPVVVFSMGKTGSTAVAHAVQEATGDRVFQVFRLRADRVAVAEDRYRANSREAKRRGRGGGTIPFPGALHLWESQHLLAHPPTPAAPWTVITTVREPIAQAASAFFHGLRRRESLAGASNVEVLAEKLVAERWIRASLHWFGREFGPALGIDVFEHRFDTDRGYAVIETPPVRVLLLRQENLAVAPQALAEFLGLSQPVPVPHRNQAATQEYASAYGQFLADVRVPLPVLDQAYKSRYARHFYAPDELARLRERWAHGPQAPEDRAQ